MLPQKVYPRLKGLIDDRAEKELYLSIMKIYEYIDINLRSQQGEIENKLGRQQQLVNTRQGQLLNDFATQLAGLQNQQTNPLAILGGGSVTSVGINLPGTVFSNGGPVTSSGNVSATFVNQNANTFFAGPTTGVAATPAFRAQVLADLPYKVYSALLTQTGTNDPTATVLGNSLSAAIAWTRTGAGTYIGTLIGAFPASKVLILVSGDVNTGLGLGVLYYASRTSSNVITLLTYSIVDATQEDDLLADTNILILVFP